MTQAQHIINRFSDAYLAAMLESTNPSEVLSAYQQMHTDLANELSQEAASLNVLYGSMANEPQPSPAEINKAYSRFALEPAVSYATATPKVSLFSKVSSVFKSRTYSFSLATSMAAVLLAVFIWKPWSPSSSVVPSVAPIISDHDNSATTANNQSSTTSQSNDPSSALYRGANEIDRSSASSKLQSQNDAKRLNKLVLTRALDAPAKIEVVPMTPGIVLVRWDAVDGALSYIVEIKNANDQDFHPVTQIARNKARITELTSGTSVSIRVTATSGERKGLPSDVKDIVVP